MNKLYSAYITLRDRGIIVLMMSIINLLCTRIQSSLMKQRYVCRNIHSYQMYLDTEDMGISRSLILFGTREIDHKIMLEKVLRPGMTVLDIGANIGYYVLMELSLIGTNGKLVAVEPSPSNIQLLRRNLDLNGYHRISVIEGAISDSTGIGKLFISELSNLNTFHNTGSAIKYLSGESIEVNTYTVPEIVTKYGAPDLIRMDVEGHEVEVINGMVDSIKREEISPKIIFETHLSRYTKEHSMVSPLNALFKLGYHVSYLSSSSEKGEKIINGLGYKGSDPISTDGMRRVIYEDIKNPDAINLICHTGGVRTVLLEKR